MSVDTIALEILLNAKATGVGAFKEMEAASDSTKNALGEFGKAAGAVGLIAGGAMVVGLGYAVKAAGDFQSQLELLHTQAGMSVKDMNAVSQAALTMGPALGVDPKTFVEGFYHVASAVSNLPPALRSVNSELDIYSSAVKLSKIGNADLEDSTQAVIGVLAAYGDTGITAAQAAGTLNQIVGAGDMRMQQLTAAMATGLLPAARNFGISLQDVGAGLATLTDNVTPADEAATRMRMTFSLMAAASPVAIKRFQEIGMSGLQLGEDLRKPEGLYGAISDLKSHLLATFGPDALSAVGHYSDVLKTQGVDAADAYAKSAGGAAAEVSRLFGGGRSSAAIMTWLGELDSLKGKYNSITDAAGSAAQFNDDWAGTQDTLNFKMQQFQAELQAGAITIGNVLLPPLSRLLDWINGVGIPAFEVFVKSIGGIEPLLWGAAGAIGILLVAALPVEAPVLAVAGAIMALAAAGGFLAAHFGPQIQGALGSLSRISGGIGGLLGLGAGSAATFGHVPSTPTLMQGGPLGRLRAAGMTPAAYRQTGAMAGGLEQLGMSPQAAVAASNQIAPAIITIGRTVATVQTDMAKGAPTAKILTDSLISLGMAAGGAKDLVRVFGEAWAALGVVFTAVRSVIEAAVQMLLTNLSSWWKGHGDEIMQIIGDNWKAITQIFEVALPIIWQIVVTVFTAVWDFIKVVWDLIVGVFNIALDLITGKWGRAWSDLLDMLNHFGHDFNQGWADLGSNVVKLLGILWQDIVQIFMKIWDDLVGHSIIPDMINAILDWFRKLPTEAVNALLDLLIGLGAFEIRLIEWALKAGAGLVNNLINGIQGVLGQLGHMAGQIGSTIVNGIVAAVNAAAGGLASAIESILPGGPGGPVVAALKAAGIPGFASGGIVYGPTLAMVGEAGPEAIVPLGRGGGGFGGQQVAVTIDLRGAVISDQSAMDKLSQAIGQSIYRQMQLSGAGWH